ncbi:MAG TPA: 50S ribosomal protein L6, partial [Firmicutes bacterium]|nr:50S ribosomal protein L6 [Bacillota bacterium]
MSRIGNRAIPIPDGTRVKINGREVVAEGQHGSLSVIVGDTVELSIDDGRLSVKNISENRADKKYHG